MLNGLAVSGVDIEFNPGQFYLAVTSGKTKNIYAEHLNLIPHSSQKILAGKLGVGKKNKTHLYLTAMHVWDQQDREPTEADSIQHRDNYIVGTDAKLSLFKNKFTLQGEFMTSFYSRDKNSTALDQEDVDYIPSWLYDQMKPTISSTLDFAYSASSAIKLRNTSFSANIRKVGPSFKSLGVPYLRNDELKYQLRFNQNFWNKRITAGAWYRRGQDNLIPWKQSTSISTSFGFDVTVKPSKRAYVKLSYSPYFVNNYSDNELYQVNTKTSIASVVTGVNTQFGETRSNTNLLISYQNNQSNARTGLYSVFSCSVNQNISLKKPFSFSGNILYNRIRHNEQLNEIYLFDLNSTYTTKKRWRNRLGIRVSFDESTDNKIGFYLNSSYPIRKNLIINFQARQNYYNMNKMTTPNQNETIFRLGVNASW